MQRTQLNNEQLDTVFRRLYTMLLNNVAHYQGDLVAHLLLYMVVRCILPVGKGSSQLQGQTQAARIKERIRRWRAGEIMALWEEAIQLQATP